MLPVFLVIDDLSRTPGRNVYPVTPKRMHFVKPPKCPIMIRNSRTPDLAHLPKSHTRHDASKPVHSQIFNCSRPGKRGPDGHLIPHKTKPGLPLHTIFFTAHDK